MDSNHKYINNNDSWEWQGEEYCLQRDSGNDFSHSLWDNVNANGDDLMCVLDEQTPIKDCAEFGYQVCDVVDTASKGLEEFRETSQMKRRRMLQFTSDANEISIGNKQFKSKVTEPSEGSLIDGLTENLEWNSEWTASFQDDRCTINFDGWDNQSEGWLANCFNESEMNCNNEKMLDCIANDEQVDVAESYTIAPETESDAVLQETPRPSPIKIIRGKKSFLETPKSLVTSVAYPFALIKPCGVQGDVTLKEINQRLHAPPPPKLNHKKDKDPSSSYPTSAFSGKLVVVKTKIRTEGGKGSITIMRTRG